MSNSLQLVLLPGFDGTGELFWPLRAALGEDVASATVRYDAERSLDEYIDSVARILPHENAVLVAESFSGPVALSLFARYPARIKCAVLCATFAVSPFRTLTHAARYMPTFLFTPTRMQKPLLRGFCLNGEGDDALVDRAASVVRSLSAATIRNRLRVLSGIDVTALLPRITAPVLYLQATRDRIVSDRLSRQLTQALPRATVQQIDGPHLLLQSRPAECATAIKRFLAHQEVKAQTPHSDPEQSYAGTPASIREET
ncbi:alpha/beta fold hydrolase [Steroidobacter agaridevorans]|uniref:alpha/beta fold hydrolase n=1 Tax=Steroidobacter agaridevorans TaxID=2695856 RepID=UPI00137B0D52